MRADMGEMRAELKSDIANLRAELRSDIASLRADVAGDFIDVRREIGTVRKELGEQIVGLRRAVVEYHTSVIGHGIIISELEARLRRVEQRLDMADDAH